MLHFESCTYEGWRNKFMKHRDMGEQKKIEIPFPFYRDSITLFQVRATNTAVRKFLQHPHPGCHHCSPLDAFAEGHVDC